MEQYKEKLKLYNILLGIGAFILAVFSFLAVGSELGWFVIFPPVAGGSHWQSAWYGFITGASFGLCATMVFFLIRNILALKNEKKLKKLYIKENDERTVQICTLARNTAMQMMLWIGIAATVIAGYFSITVSITILACTFVSSVLGLLLMAYYSKKF